MINKLIIRIIIFIIICSFIFTSFVQNNTKNNTGCILILKKKPIYWLNVHNIYQQHIIYSKNKYKCNKYNIFSFKEKILYNIINQIIFKTELRDLNFLKKNPKESSDIFFKIKDQKVGNKSIFEIYKLAINKNANLNNYLYKNIINFIISIKTKKNIMIASNKFYNNTKLNIYDYKKNILGQTEINRKILLQLNLNCKYFFYITPVLDKQFILIKYKKIGKHFFLHDQNLRKLYKKNISLYLIGRKVFYKYFFFNLNFPNILKKNQTYIVFNYILYKIEQQKINFSNFIMYKSTDNKYLKNLHSLNCMSKTQFGKHFNMQNNNYKMIIKNHGVVITKIIRFNKNYINKFDIIKNKLKIKSQENNKTNIIKQIKLFKHILFIRGINFIDFFITKINNFTYHQVLNSYRKERLILNSKKKTSLLNKINTHNIIIKNHILYYIKTKKYNHKTCAIINKSHADRILYYLRQEQKIKYMFNSMLYFIKYKNHNIDYKYSHDLLLIKTNTILQMYLNFFGTKDKFYINISGNNYIIYKLQSIQLRKTIKYKKYNYKFLESEYFLYKQKIFQDSNFC